MGKQFLIIPAVIFLTLRVSMATTYYVSPNGNNSHTGNPANPWKIFA